MGLPRCSAPRKEPDLKDFISLDFESRSTVDLPRTGVYPYAVHESTDLWCMAYALGDAEVQLWLPGDPVPGEIQYALDNDYDFRAWNAQFERIMWREIAAPRYGFPTVPLVRWVDSAAEAAAMALPRHLFQAAQVLGVDQQKDSAGHRLMMRMAKPRKARKHEDPRKLYWWDDADRLARLCDYCQQDVRTERAIVKRLRRLTDTERQVYLLDQRINDRGVQIDTDLAAALQNLADEAVERANVRLTEITSGRVEAVTNVQNTRQWLAENGVDLADLTKQTVAETLEEELEEGVREVLLLRQENGKTSTRKLAAMKHATSGIDNRARGLLLYHGAGTGRWSGKLIQPQNFPRPTEKNVERYIDRILANDFDGLEAETPIMPLVSNMLRSCFQSAPGHRFMCADFSAIEGHVTSWLAGQDAMMSYEEMASAIYGVPAEEIENPSDERFVGKTIVLGGGFGMGWKKYQAQLKSLTGIEVEDAVAKRVVDTYREKNHKIKALWYSLQAAALHAVQHPGKVCSAGRNEGIKYVLRSGFLWCVLPSGRALAYADPRLTDRPTPWGTIEPSVEVSTVDSVTRKWVRRDLYGGLQTENVVQAIARDLMAASMLRVEEAGYPVVLTVHDEILAEVPVGHGSLEEYNTLMSQRPAWGEHIPVKVEGWEGERYRK